MFLKLLLKRRTKGSSSSGNWGHEGIEGHEGGSAPSGYRSFANLSEASEYAAKNLAGALSGGNMLQLGAVKSYTEDSKDTNTALRSGAFEAGKAGTKTQARIERLDAIMAREEAVVKEPITVMRCFGNVGGKDFFAGHEVGEVFSDKAFVSTSVNPEIRFGGRRTTIRVPAGARGVYVQKISGRPEYEFLMARNTKFKIASMDNDMVVLEVVV